MSAAENKALAREFFESFNTGNLDQIVGLLTPDYQHHDPNLPPELQRGREAYRQGAAMFLGAFPDLQVSIEDQVAEGDKVVCRSSVRGTHRGELMGMPPTGKQVAFPMITVQRVASGKIAEGWVSFDALGMLQQLGAIPAPGAPTA